MKNSIKKENYLHKIMIQNRTTYNVEKYTRYKNILTSCLQTAELDYCSAIFENSMTSTFKLWKSLGRKKVRWHTVVNKLLSGDIAQVINQYSELKSKIPNKGNDFIQYLPPPHPTQHTHTHTPCNCKFIFPYSIMWGRRWPTRTKKSHGTWWNQHKDIAVMPPKYLHLIWQRYIYTYVYIYNGSLETGEYPSALKKKAKVIALFKGGTRYDTNNYRLISLPSCFNTIFQKLIRKSLTSFLEINKTLYCYRYGFRKLHSTSLAPIEFTDAIGRFLDQGQHVISVFIDLRKSLTRWIMISSCIN